MGLDSVALVMAWEEHFEIKISDEVAATLETSRNAIDAIEKLLNDSTFSKRTWTRVEIEQAVRRIIIEQLGVSPQDFTLDSFFVRDLGVD